MFSFTQKVKELQTTLDKIAIEKENIIQERDHLKEQLSENQANIENMSNDLNKLVSEKEELNTKFEALNDQLVETESERDRTRQEVDSLSLINADLISRHQELENTLNDLRAQSNDSNAALAQERDSLKVKLEEVSIDLENMSTVREDLVKQRDELSGKVAELEAKHNSSSAEYEARLEVLQSQVNTLTEAAEALKTQLQMAIDVRTEAQNKAEQLEEWYKSNCVAIEEYKQVVGDLEAAKRSKEAVDEELKVIREGKQTSEAALNELKEQGSADLANLMRERDSLNEKVIHFFGSYQFHRERREALSFLFY